MIGPISSLAADLPRDRQTVEQSVGKPVSVGIIDQEVSEIGTAKPATDPPFQTANAQNFLSLFIDEPIKLLEQQGLRGIGIAFVVILAQSGCSSPPAGPRLIPDHVVDHVPLVNRERVDAAIAAMRFVAFHAAAFRRIFFSGLPAVCTGANLTIAKKFRIIRRRQRRTFRN